MLKILHHLFQETVPNTIDTAAITLRWNRQAGLWVDHISYQEHAISFRRALSKAFENDLLDWRSQGHCVLHPFWALSLSGELEGFCLQQAHPFVSPVGGGRARRMLQKNTVRQCPLGQYLLFGPGPWSAHDRLEHAQWSQCLGPLTASLKTPGRRVVLMRRPGMSCVLQEHPVLLQKSLIAAVFYKHCPYQG